MSVKLKNYKLLETKGLGKKLNSSSSGCYIARNFVIYAGHLVLFGW